MYFTTRAVLVRNLGVAAVNGLLKTQEDTRCLSHRLTRTLQDAGRHRVSGG